MTPTRRRFVALAASSAVAVSLGGRASAQTWPSRYVKLVVPFPPAGSADVVARLLADRLSEKLGQQIVIENKGGAGGNIEPRHAGFGNRRVVAPDRFFHRSANQAK